jgi:UPF0176 protein
MPPILNIAAYRFVPLPDAAALAPRLRQTAEDAQLKGTVLLAEEGINLFLAGPAEAVRRWLEALGGDERFADLPVKESWSEAVPFRRLLVKVKREIIRMNLPEVTPDTQAQSTRRAPAVSASTLKRWLDNGHDDDGRAVLMLDTRNGFEVDAGAFEGALDWRLRKFSDFPAALAAHRAELAGKTIVTYCTGGIRCEKAALLMQRQGLAHTWQLDGGILKYFEEVGLQATAPHYRGTCFVFDDRVTLNANLAADAAAPASAMEAGPGRP